MPRLGDAIALAVQLADGNTGKFPRATIRDDSNVILYTVALASQGSGMYTNVGVTMPNRPFVVAEYEIFDDSGFVTPSTGYPKTMDRFELISGLRGGSSNFTAAMLCSLEAAIAQGALKVKYSDKEVTYRSITEMMQVRDLIRRELGMVGNNNLRILPSFSKGF